MIRPRNSFFIEDPESLEIRLTVPINFLFYYYIGLILTKTAKDEQVQELIRFLSWPFMNEISYLRLVATKTLLLIMRVRRI